MRLFIAEKPELAKAICVGLGGGFTTHDGYHQKGNDTVTWCYGHMLQLFLPKDYDPKYEKWKFEDLPFMFLPVKRKMIPKSEKQTKIIGNLISQANSIVHAGDPDDEGQLLVDELLHFFNFNGQVDRVIINANTQKVVNKALENIEPNSKYVHQGYQAEARSIADQLFGFNLSRAYTLNHQCNGGQDVISLGRVQTPVLGLIVRRCRANKAHEKALYYLVNANFDFNGINFNGAYTPNNEQVDDKGRLINKTRAEEIAKICSNQAASITSVETKQKQQAAPLPYNLIKLQTDAARKFGYKLDYTLAVTQTLREKHKLITYNRSDCQYLPDEEFEEAESVLSAVAQTAKVFAGAVSNADFTIKSRAFSSDKVTAHHAIIPTDTVANLDDLSESEKNIYLLIARSYIAQFYPKYSFDSTSIVVDVDSFMFKANGKVDKVLGWKNLYKNDTGNEETKDKDDVIYVDLRVLNSSDKGSCLSANCNEKETKPPALYSTETLGNDLTRVAKYVKDPKLAAILRDKDKDNKDEHGGIGTPATRSTIVNTLYERGYIVDDKKKIISTPLGEKLYDVLDDKIRYPDLTAIWHDAVQNVKTPEDVHAFVKQVMSDAIVSEVERLKTTNLSLAESFKCPKCSRPMYRRKGKKGFFWGCSGYNAEENPCKHIMSDRAGKPVETKRRANNQSERTNTDFECESCKSKLIYLKGVSTKTNKPYSFFACSNTSDCNRKFSEKDNKPVFEK